MFQGILLRCILMSKKLNSLFASLTALYPTLKSMGFTAISIITYNTRDFAGVEQFGLSLLEPSEFLRLIGKLP